MPAIPVALFWAAAFFLVRKRRVIRIALVAVASGCGLIALGPIAFLVGAPAIIVAVITVAAFEWSIRPAQ